MGANPKNASRWKINKSAQYTKGAPKSKFEAMKEGADAPNSSRPTKEYPEGTLVALPGQGQTVELKLESKADVSADTRVFRFALPSEKHVLGLPVGQHVTMSTKGS